MIIFAFRYGLKFLVCSFIKNRKFNMTHHTHPDIIKRLRRAHGHLRVTIELIEKGHPCSKLSQQLHAVEKAIANAKKVLIYDHINHCLEQSIEESPQSMKDIILEFKSISKYL